MNIPIMIVSNSRAEAGPLKSVIEAISCVPQFQTMEVVRCMPTGRDPSWEMSHAIIHFTLVFANAEPNLVLVLGVTAIPLVLKHYVSGTTKTLVKI